MGGAYKSHTQDSHHSGKPNARILVNVQDAWHTDPAGQYPWLPHSNPSFVSHPPPFPLPHFSSIPFILFLLPSSSLTLLLTHPSSSFLFTPFIILTNAKAGNQSRQCKASCSVTQRQQRSNLWEMTIIIIK